MSGHNTTHIRNIALLGHSGSGKTTLLERLACVAGHKGSPGSIERGDTISDHDAQEKQYQHSLFSSIVPISHKDCLIQCIDTPGDPDFRGQTLAAMSAVETAAMVINAAQGVELSTRRLLRRARQRRLCRLLIINRIDMPELDLAALVEHIRDEFGPECLPVNLPAADGSKVLDCFFPARDDVEQTDILTLTDAHNAIRDQVIEVDEALMERYLAGAEISRQQLHDAFDQALRENHLIPICFVSAATGAGCMELLELGRRLLPNPTEGNLPRFRLGNEERKVTASADAQDHVIAHVFKIINDPYAGKLSVFRIFQGTVRAGMELFIGGQKKPFKVAHLYRLNGAAHEQIEQAVPGDICAVAKVDDIHYDAILHDHHEEDHHYLKPIDFPQPMFGLAITAQKHGQEQKLADALAQLSDEDPCVRVEHHQELNETVLYGLGEMHLRMLLERLQQRFDLKLATSTPGIAYRETITRPAEGHYRHKKQTGGAGQFGEVFLRVRPLQRDAGVQFKSEVTGGAIPTSLIPAVEKGVLQAVTEGCIAGYPLQDLEVVVYDGKHHSVDSKEIAFVVAGRKAFMEAVQAAGPQLLEPIVELDVLCPQANLGDVTSALAARRARIQGSESIAGGMAEIHAGIPQAMLSDFPTELKSLTSGGGRYSMAFSHYEAVPPDVQQQLVAACHQRGDSD